MPRFYRFFPLIVSVPVFVIFEILYQRPAWVIVLAAILPILFLVALLPITRWSGLWKDAPLRSVALASALSWAGLIFSLLVETAFFRHVLALVTVLFLALFFESVLTYLQHRAVYENYSLENLSGYALTLTMFLGVSSLYGLRVLLGLNFGLTALIFLIVLVAINNQFFWISRINSKEMLYFVGVLNLVILELFLVFAVLPFHFMISGALVTVLWYTALSISRAELLNLSTKKTLTRLLGLGGGLVAILLIVARWV